MLHKCRLPSRIWMGGPSHSIVYRGEGNRNARLKTRVNMVCPGKQRGDYYVLCLEQRVCVKKGGPYTHIAVL